jgi:hypothetical protein
MLMASFIQHIELVWLSTLSPGARSSESVCMMVPEMA